MNPYNPSFGSVPDRFLGREHIVLELKNSLRSPNSPWRSTLITGVRGTGKTALLNDYQILMEKQGGIAVMVSSSENLLDDILSELYFQLPDSISKKLKNISGFSIMGASLALNKEAEPEFTKNFRYQLKLMLEELQKKKIPIAFLIDEVQQHTPGMRTFVSTYQTLLMERYPVYLLMAGLPSAISDVLNDKVLTFLRRANRVELRNVSERLVEADFVEAFSHREDNLPKELAHEAARATQGYPYLIQLVGYFLWEQKRMTQESLDLAVAQSKNMHFHNVLDLIYRDLSEMDQHFIKAMAEDSDLTEVSVLQERLGKNGSYVSMYRNRLISAGVIESAGYGKVKFALPYFAEFLNELESW